MAGGTALAGLFVNGSLKEPVSHYLKRREGAPAGIAPALAADVAALFASCLNGAVVGIAVRTDHAVSSPFLRAINPSRIQS